MLKRFVLFAAVVPVLGCSADVGRDLARSRTAVTSAVPTPLTPSEDVKSFEYGAVVATDSQSVLVAANSPDAATDSLAFLFSRGTDSWSESKVFTPSDQGSLFATGLAVRGDTIAIGGGGSVVVYRGSGAQWKLEATLSDQALNVNFGDALALDTDRLAVGDPEDIFPDSVYVYQRSGTSWSQAAHLTPSDTTDDVSFGAAVALAGDVLVVGAPGPVVAPLQNGPLGAAYVYRLQGGTWVQTQKLASSTPTAGDRFGETLALSGTTLAVGASHAPGASSVSGTVTLFEDSAGTFQESANVVSLVAGAGFGAGVSLDADTLIVGSGLTVDDSGHVETFNRDASGWTPGPSLSDPSLAAGASFGAALAVSGQIAAVGAPGGNAAYAYLLLDGKQCSADKTSVEDTNGKLTSCAPYFCAQGACATNCASSTDCTTGNVCDKSLGKGQCVPSSHGSSSQSDSGGCSATGKPREGGTRLLLGLLAVAIAGARARRRPRR